MDNGYLTTSTTASTASTASTLRPTISRARSNTEPSTQPKIAITDVSSNETSPKQIIQRPSAHRAQSHSLVTSGLKKDSPSTSSPPSSADRAAKTERTAGRLRIPGSSHLRDLASTATGGAITSSSDRADRRHSSRHRHTRSDVLHPSASAHNLDIRKGPIFAAKDAEPDLRHLTASLAKERREQEARKADAAAEQAKSTRDALRLERKNTNTGSSFRAQLQQQSHYGAPNGALVPAPVVLDDATVARLRATSDVLARKSPRTQVEIALERGDAKAVARRAGYRAKDVEGRRREGRAAQAELRERLVGVGKMGMELTRRLDYTYYSLLEKVGNLVATIHGFAKLREQMKQLGEGFEREAGEMQGDVRGRVGRFREGFEERGRRVDELESRGFRANARARDLGERLGKAREVVEEWEAREKAGLRRWGNFTRSCRLCAFVVFSIVFAVVFTREWRSVGNVVSIALGVPASGHHNRSLHLDESTLRKVELPEEVRQVLKDIDERRRISDWSRGNRGQPIPPEVGEERRLHVLEEL